MGRPDPAPATAAARRRAATRLLCALLVFVLCQWYAPPPAEAQQLKNRTFNLDIVDGRLAIENRTIRVTQGDQLDLVWTTDKPAELHLHGYDMRLNVIPKQPTRMNFEANTTGRYPFTVHGTGGHHGRALLYLEVHPR
jgi:hypothetical protein